jgi:NAD(P)-dependent dehydrogenase (short-subunit alcohol dehydrogenase family)
MTKTVLITGASTGIGYATAKFLAAQGWRVLAGARKQEDIDRLSNENGVFGFALDVTNDEQVEALGDMLSRECPSGLDGLINNAGIAVTGPWEFVDPEDLRRQFDVNVFGLVDITRVALPFVRRACGRVVNVGSIAGLIADALLGPYAASKFAVEAITDSLRREVAPLGVQVCSINPGPIDTPILYKVKEKLYSSEEEKRVYGARIEKRVAAFLSQRKNAEPVEIVTKAIHHALTAKSPRARYYVGKGSRLIATLSKLPERVLDAILNRWG